jgi:hypothetical protein
MAKPQLQVESDDGEVRETTADSSLSLFENEIECPRCHGYMTLRSEFDSLHYFCESCDFCLFTLKKS